MHPRLSETICQTHICECQRTRNSTNMLEMHIMERMPLRKPGIKENAFDRLCEVFRCFDRQ